MAKSTTSFGLDKKSKKYFKDLQKQLDPKVLLASLVKFFDRQGSFVAGQIIKKFLSGQLLGVRTGSLRRSIVGVGVNDKGAPGMRIGVFRGPALAYAGIHEHGGTILPKKAKSLAIPQPAVLTPAGVSKYGGPRNYPGDLKFVPFRNSGIAIGGLFDAESLKGSDDLRNGIMAYMLVKKVQIKPKKYLQKGLAANISKVTKALSIFLRDQFLSKDNPSRGKQQ